MASKAANPFAEPEAIKRFRRKHRINQSMFWARLGVTQSGGSRYENGRAIPNAVVMLLNITYGTNRGAEKLVEQLRAWKDPSSASKV